MIPMLITAAHLWALGELETGQDDFAVGSHGEVSRYQVMPSIWFDRAGTQNPHDKKLAAIVAGKIWQSRVVRFEKTHQRSPTMEELALLWHSPSRVDSPRMAEWDYACRFKNLLDKYEPEQKRH